eukprot:TRINITY_DN2458_c0_g2_i1.p1 TRINITY_DN2458_c0_g2~~TRINITY_DN2458_c0_g2_i1.p1  ORF type:complete len:537 (-),score=48.98 TRINITY_DN2458_c0_g2_i1:422-1846(-)
MVATVKRTRVPVPGEDGNFPLYNTLKLFAPEFGEEMYAKYGESWSTRTIGGPMVILSNKADRERFLIKEDNLVSTFSTDTFNKILGTDSLSLLQGDEHKNLRRALKPLFEPVTVANKLQAVNKAFDDTIIRYKVQEGVQVRAYEDLIKWFTGQTMQFIIFGEQMSDEDVQMFVEYGWNLSYGLQDPFGFNLPFTKFGRAMKAKKQVQDIVVELLKTRGSRDGSSLIDLMIKATDVNGNELSLKTIQDNVVLFLIASMGTTSEALARSIHNLTLHPEALVQLREEVDSIDLDSCSASDFTNLEYLDGVIKESLRLDPVVPALARKALEDIDIGEDYFIPKGALIMINNNQKFQYDERFAHMKGEMAQDKFAPQRWSEAKALEKGAIYPFGMGARICIGLHYAELEMRLFLANFVKKFEWEMVDPNEEWIIGPFKYPKKGMPMKVTPRLPRAKRSLVNSVARARVISSCGLNYIRL